MVKNLLKKIFVSEELEFLMKSMKKEVGSYGYDPWGYNEEVAKTALGVFKKLHDNYFRVEHRGLHNVPAQGRVLIIPNHSGQLPLDAGFIATSLATREKGPRLARGMAERWFPTVPWLGNFINLTGMVIGDPVNCGRMLEREEAIIVFPEGVRGSGKIFKERYKLKRFGNGFMHLAITHKTPIVPVGVVGCEETIISFADIKPLAKALAIPYAPLIIPFVFPAKVYLNFGEPMYFEGDITSEYEVAEKVEKVKKRIGELIEEGLENRKGWF